MCESLNPIKKRGGRERFPPPRINNGGSRTRQVERWERGGREARRLGGIRSGVGGGAGGCRNFPAEPLTKRGERARGRRAGEWEDKRKSGGAIDCDRAPARRGSGGRRRRSGRAGGEKKRSGIPSHRGQMGMDTGADPAGGDEPRFLAHQQRGRRFSTGRIPPGRAKGFCAARSSVAPEITARSGLGDRCRPHPRLGVSRGARDPLPGKVAFRGAAPPRRRFFLRASTPSCAEKCARVGPAVGARGPRTIGYVRPVRRRMPLPGPYSPGRPTSWQKSQLRASLACLAVPCPRRKNKDFQGWKNRDGPDLFLLINVRKAPFFLWRARDF
jgi:hypothetical protein